MWLPLGTYLFRHHLHIPVLILRSITKANNWGWNERIAWDVGREGGLLRVIDKKELSSGQARIGREEEFWEICSIVWITVQFSNDRSRNENLSFDEIYTPSNRCPQNTLSPFSNVKMLVFILIRAICSSNYVNICAYNPSLLHKGKPVSLLISRIHNNHALFKISQVVLS